jgi:uncharacterized protein YutE (UPF0331/DUF86 family)
MDRALIRRRLADLQRNLQTLQQWKSVPYENWAASTEKIWAVEHGLQTSIQIVLDIGNHLLADLGENKVEDYSSVIIHLGTAGILPIEFSEKIRPMAGFRNLLVHEYAELDLTEVHRMLRDHLGDFEEFGKHIEAYLSKADKT